MQTFLWISLGAVAGANLRYLISHQLGRVSALFPYGTLVVNVSGSLLIGLFLAWSAGRVAMDPRWRLLIAVGFCGGYTTFSSYAFETVALAEDGRWLPAALNVIASNLLCLAAVLIGALLGRSL